MCDHLQIRRWTEYWLGKLNVDLRGKTVLSEAATGSFSSSAVIPLVAGAKKVIAVGRDTQYGKFQEAKSQVIDLCRFFELDVSKIQFAEETASKKMLAEVDVVLNCGHVRPINRTLISGLKKDSSIGLMYESWELRDSDIDVQACEEHGVTLIGVDESSPELEIFQGVGYLGLKMLFDAGVEVFKSKIVLWSDDKFGEEIEKVCVANGAKVVKTLDVSELEKIVEDADVLFLCQQNERRQLIGECGLLSLAKLKAANSSLKLVHLYGQVSTQFATDEGFDISPSYDGRAEYMSRTLDYLGFRFSIGLFVAGLKVANVRDYRECSYAQKIV